MLGPFPRFGVQAQLYLTQSVNQTLLASQSPRKVVNLLSTISNENIKMTVLWRSGLLKIIELIHSER